MFTSLLLAFAAACFGVIAAICLNVSRFSFARAYTRNTHYAEQFACQYVEAVEEIASDNRFSSELVGFLVGMGKLIDDAKFARMIGRHFIGITKLPAAEIDSDLEVSSGTNKFFQALDRLDHNQKLKFFEAITLFLAAVSYKDFIYGREIRAVLMGRSRQKEVARETKELVRVIAKKQKDVFSSARAGDLAHAS